ncbi:helix-turn-helix transcriptional regulator [Achromobacter sp. CSND-B12]|uniref:helix-turn-helix transcriptional regulator n=1 Tax=Achromobacter sp. CSND-B12 TaxID=3462570 RepID=UPI00406A86C7
MITTVATSARSAVPNAVPFTLIEDQFVDMTFMTQYTGLTDKWFYKLIQEGKFPRPVKFGRSSRWLKSELEAWIQERIQDSRAA